MKLQRLSLRGPGLLAGVLMSIAGARAQVNISIGAMQPGEEVVVTYEVTLNSSLLPAVTQISSQGTVTGTGFTSPKSTDDPETGTADDATLFALQNDAPTITATDTAAYTENGSAVALSPSLTVTDGDSANLAGAMVSISAGFVAGDTLGFADQNGISGSYNSGSGVLTLTGSATVAQYQSALRSVTFSSTSENPTLYGANTSRTLAFVGNDGIADGAAGESTVNVTAANDAPVLSAGNTIGYTENGAAAAVSPALTLTDADHANLASASVSIASGFVAGDLLSFVDQNGISGAYNTASGILSLSGSSSTANYQTALRSVTFSSSSDDPTAGASSPSRTVAFVANDGVSQSGSASTTVNVTGVNDNPVGVADGIQRAPNDDTKVKVSTLLANDSDPDGGSLSITSVASPSTGGATVTLSGGWILYAHSGTIADEFSYTLSDGQGGSSVVTVTVAIQGEDTQAGPALTPAVDANGAHVSFFGIPARTYTMQSASSVVGPWSDKGVAIEDDHGHYVFTDNGGLPANFYRAVYRP